MNRPIPLKMTKRHRPLWGLYVGASDALFLKTKFSQYDSAKFSTLLGGYHKAFDTYYIFRLTNVLYELRTKLGLVLSNERQVDLTAKKDLCLENSMLIENFIVLLQVLMDQIAVYMPFFFAESEQHKLLMLDDDQIRKGHFKSFAQIRITLSENKKIDLELTSHMSKNLAWFDEINNLRNSLIHGAGWLWIEPHDISSKDYKFKIVSGLLMKKEWEPSLKDYVAIIYYNFREFLSFYEKHFCQKCESNFKEFRWDTDPCWESADSQFYKSMDCFYEEGKALMLKA
ncbi:MAG: hypothetical protein HZB85_09265 [Deltaproteobacteria bacterium]|nr:hypothetical protein [Deltaproteobacteria bacterium]